MSTRIRNLALVVGGLLFTVVGLAVLAPAALAHECPAGTGPTSPECQPAAVYPDWRPNYVPVMDLQDRSDEQQKRDAQRWRDENGCHGQFCVWADPSGSVDDEAGPGTLHAGSAGDHSLGEGAHSDEGHEQNEFGNHDTHGGSIYADICAGSDAGTSYEGRAGDCTGPEDTQVGITIVDHLTCPMGCMDEYHVVRPLDSDYTEAQVANSARDTETALSDPQRHLCGYEQYDSAC